MYKHSYAFDPRDSGLYEPLTHCPACSHDLRQEGGVEVECCYNGMPAWFEARLEDGLLTDCPHAERGLHSQTLCNGCYEPLINFAGVKEDIEEVSRAQ